MKTYFLYRESRTTRRPELIAASSMDEAISAVRTRLPNRRSDDVAVFKVAYEPHSSDNPTILDMRAV